MKIDFKQSQIIKICLVVIVTIVTIILFTQHSYASTDNYDRKGFTGGTGIGIGGFLTSTGEGFPSVFFKGELGYGINNEIEIIANLELSLSFLITLSSQLGIRHYFSEKPYSSFLQFSYGVADLANIFSSLGESGEYSAKVISIGLGKEISKRVHLVLNGIGYFSLKPYTKSNHDSIKSIQEIGFLSLMLNVHFN